MPEVIPPDARARGGVLLAGSSSCSARVVLAVREDHLFGIYNFIEGFLVDPSGGERSLLEGNLLIERFVSYLRRLVVADDGTERCYKHQGVFNELGDAFFIQQSALNREDAELLATVGEN